MPCHGGHSKLNKFIGLCVYHITQHFQDFIPGPNSFVFKFKLTKLRQTMLHNASAKQLHKET